MVTEDYCSQEVYRLLKEKGFNGEIHTTFDKEGYTQPAITHQMAMKWIREIYDIFIIIRRGLTGTGWVYSHEIYKDSQCLYAQYGASYDTYKEAVEAALKYSLEKLI